MTRAPGSVLGSASAALIACTISTAAGAQSLRDAAPLVTIQRTETVGTVKAGPSASETRRDPLSVELRTAGGRPNQCGATGGQDARAQVVGSSTASRTQNAVAVQLVTSVESRGGAALECSTCLGDLCLSPRLADVEAQAAMTSTVVLDIRVPEVRTSRQLTLALNGTTVLTGAEFRYEVSDGGGGPVASGSSLPATVNLSNGATGDTWTVTMSVTASSGAAGSCCAKSAAGQASIDTSVLLAPLATAAIADAGVASDRHGAVGLLMLEGRPHCPATLISPTQVLTASQCVRDYELGSLGFISPVDSTEPFKGGRNLLTSPSPVSSYLSSDTTRLEMLTAPSNLSVVQLSQPQSGAATAVPVQEVHPTPGMPLRAVLFSALELSRQELDVRVIAVSDRTLTVGADKSGACGMVGSPLFADGRRGTAPIAIVTAVERDRCVASRLDRSSPWMREVLK